MMTLKYNEPKQHLLICKHKEKKMTIRVCDTRFGQVLGDDADDAE
jgi:hypothetical protein